MLGHRLPQLGQPLGEADQLVVLRLLLTGSEVRVVEVLLAPRSVDTGCLKLGARGRRDPDVLPGRGDRERAIRSSFASSVIGLPAASTYRNRRFDPSRRHPIPRAILCPLPAGGPPLIFAAVELKSIVVLEGDQTGQELLEESLRVLAPDVIGLELELPRFDLSLESRRATKNGVVHEAAAAIRGTASGSKERR